MALNLLFQCLSEHRHALLLFHRNRPQFTVVKQFAYVVLCRMSFRNQHSHISRDNINQSKYAVQ